MTEQERQRQDLALLVQRLEALVNKPDALVRIGFSPDHDPSRYVMANRAGMLALGLECLKASSGPSTSYREALSRAPTPALAYLAGGDCERLGGLLVDDELKYRVAPTADQQDEKDRRDSLILGVLLSGFAGFACVGFLVAVRFLWRLVF
ncbi:MAG: hypothetical protein AAF184_11790 [Pseudomonadota bacterium]